MRMVPILELPHVFILLGLCPAGHHFPCSSAAAGFPVVCGGCPAAPVGTWVHTAGGHALPMRLGAAVRSYSPSAFICGT